MGTACRLAFGRDKWRCRNAVRSARLARLVAVQPCELPLAVHVLPVSRGSAAFGTSRAAVPVSIVDPLTKLRVDPHQAAQLLGLTSAEGSVVARLAEGMSVRQIVDASGRAENTVRSRVKQALAKTGCSRQAELVRLALLPSRPLAARSESSDSQQAVQSGQASRPQHRRIAHAAPCTR